MNDTKAVNEAKRIAEDFWRKFESALEPKRASKQAYADALEELITDAEMKLECVKQEIDAEGGDE